MSTDEVKSPQGKLIEKDAAAFKKRTKRKKSKETVREEWYELAGNKLLKCHRIDTGTVMRVYCGSTASKKSGKEIQEFVKKLQAEKKLRVRV